MTNTNQQGELIHLFPVPVVKINIGRSFTKEETDCIANIPFQKKIGDPHQQSECFEIFDNFAEELKDIKVFCEHELKRYLEEIEGVDTDRVDLRITQSWLNKIESQESHPSHNHQNSHLSGVLYIKCLPNDNIQFRDQFKLIAPTLNFPKKKKTNHNDAALSVNIKEGDFIIFPSLVLHGVGGNETKDKERISLSFDTFPKDLPSLYPSYHEGSL